MLDQNAGSGDSVFVVIALLAMVIFILMLFVALVITRSETKTKNKAELEQEHKSGLTAGGHPKIFSRDRPNGEGPARQSGIPESLKPLNWVVCSIIATFVAFLGYSHAQSVLLALFQIPGYYYWSAHILAIISPICVAVAWLRLTGVPWRQALSLFLVVPTGAYVIWYITNSLVYRLLG